MAPVSRRCRWRRALLQVCCAWCLVFATCYDLWTGHKINYEDETHHPSTGGTDGGGGCGTGRWRGPRQQAPGRTDKQGFEPPTTASATHGAYH